MSYFFCLLSAEECKDPTHFGFNYAKKKESEWISAPVEIKEFASVGAKGQYYVYKDEKAYMLFKYYYDSDNTRIVIICKESKDGCDTRDNF